MGIAKRILEQKLFSAHEKVITPQNIPDKLIEDVLGDESYLIQADLCGNAERMPWLSKEK